MKYFEYQEHRQQGTQNFPIAYYHVEETQPRYYMTSHWHPEYEIIRILEGELHLTVNNNDLTLTKGDILLLQDGVLHGGTPKRCIYECLVFDMLTLLKDNRILKEESERIIRHETVFQQLLPKDDTELTGLIAELFTSMQEKRAGYEFIVQGSLYQLLGMLFDKKLYDLAPKPEQHSIDRLKHLKQVIRFIETNYSDDIRLDDLASIAGMNPKYFCRFFRQSTQKTPIHYLNYYRIERASELLRTTDTSITDVALNCGYNDISYFIKAFKRYKNTTPKQYMKQNRVTISSST